MPDLFPLVRPFLHALPPEPAHRLTIAALRAGLGPRQDGPDDPALRIRLWGLDFPNPVGLAAGFDKNAEVVGPLHRLGFGFVEIGSVTPRPQPGGPKPRMFRIAAREALINRLGFNNQGMAAAAARLGRCRSGIVGVNLGRNKDSADAVADYRAGVRTLGPLADYMVVNVSSPNTPGLRALQGREPLTELLAAVTEARAELPSRPPILLKIAPDLTERDREDIAGVALSSGIDGLIVSNTTTTRPDGLPSDLAAEAGGLSGRPLFELATRTLRDMALLTDGKLPLVGVGGIASAADAYAKIRAGASLVQLYTALAYRGPALVAAIKRGLAAALRADGFHSVAEAVGADLRGGGCAIG
ncbi:MAG TPA: quinone-dependent dihydroorotate dehydrogenase [Alphaproteobacteria bacterium]|nr:quinone-dependent dihydroorotate dehydrogenase [Alphaproteobacteria bacterium]